MNTQPRTTTASFRFPAIVVAGLALAVALGIAATYYNRGSDSDSDSAFLSPSGPGTIPTQDELNAAAIAEHEAHMEAIYGPYTPPASVPTNNELEAAVLEHDNHLSGAGILPPFSEPAPVSPAVDPSFDELMNLALADYWNLVANVSASVTTQAPQVPETLDQLMQQALYSYESWAAAYVQAE